LRHDKEDPGRETRPGLATAKWEIRPVSFI